MAEKTTDWRLLIPVACFGIAAAGLIAWLVSSRSATVHFVSALDEPVVIQVDDQPGFTVDHDKLRNVSRDLSKGPHTVRVRSKSGELLDESAIDVPGGVACALYNVLGAAMIRRESVTYVSESMLRADFLDPDRVTFLGDRVFYTSDKVDHVLQPPPDRIRTKVPIVTLWVVDELDGSDWQDTAVELARQGRDEAAYKLVARVAAINPTDAALLSRAVNTLLQAGLVDRLGRLTEALLPRAPDALVLAKLYQDAQIADGQRAALIAKYEAAYRAQPSAEAAYLWARVLPTTARRERLRASAAEYPSSELLRKALTEEPRDWFRTRDDAMTAGEPEPYRSALANLRLEADSASPSERFGIPLSRELVLVTKAATEGATTTVDEYLRQHVDPISVARFDPGLTASLVAALAKSGRREKAEELFKRSWFGAVPLATARAAILDGEVDAELLETQGRARAALMLALAIHATDPGQKQRWANTALAASAERSSVRMLIKRWL